MAPFDNCFADNVVKPVEFISTGPSGSSSHQCTTLEELNTYFNDPKSDDYTCLVISICQRGSWMPLEVTKPMLQCISTHYGIGSSMWDLPSCFYRRNMDVEEAFCIPYTQSKGLTNTEVSYTIRYPEFKESETSWVIRQTGVYHRFQTPNQRSIYILFSPTFSSKAHQHVKNVILQNNTNWHPEGDFLWLHRHLFATYQPGWRRYIAENESELLQIRNSTIAQYINEPLTTGYEQLGLLVSLENRFLQIPTILSHATEVLTELLNLLRDEQLCSESNEVFQCQRRECGAYSRTATYLRQRAQTTVQLLAETLSLRDQVITKDQNMNMLQLNKSVFFITAVTLFYLPASFVSTFFGMNFFAMDDINSRIVGTSMIWIYVVVAVSLTALTFIFYIGLSLLHDNERPPGYRNKIKQVLKTLWTGKLARRDSNLKQLG